MFRCGRRAEEPDSSLGSDTIHGDGVGYPPTVEHPQQAELVGFELGLTPTGSRHTDAHAHAHAHAREIIKEFRAVPR
jgi:hypothetical protein